MITFTFSMMQEMISIARKNGLNPEHWNVNSKFVATKAAQNLQEGWVSESYMGLRQKNTLYRFEHDYFPVQLDCGTHIILLRRNGQIEVVFNG